MSLFKPAAAALIASAALGLGVAAWAATPPPGVPDLHTLDLSQPRFAEAARLMQGVHESMEAGALDPQVLTPKLRAFAAELARVVGSDPKATEAYVMQEAHEMITAHLDPAALQQLHSRPQGAPAGH